MSGNAMRWRVLGASVRGTSHQRKGTPNEDAWGTWHSSEHQLVMGVVADGHGDSRSMRSHVGSRLAVEAARQVVKDRAAEWWKADGDRREKVAEACAKAVIERWRQLVAEDLMRNPLRVHEFDKLESKTAREAVLNPVVAYGSTILMTVAAPDGMAHIGVGDGDILGVDADGRSRALLGDDSPYIANETASLCMNDAFDAIRVVVQERGGGADPALVLLCTDGVSNAFRRRQGFYQLGIDLLHDVRDRTEAAIAEDLPGWLADFSSQGSGDDVTLCALVAPEVEQGRDHVVAITGQPEEEGASSGFQRLEGWEQQTEPCALPAESSLGGPIRPRMDEAVHEPNDERGWLSRWWDTVSSVFGASTLVSDQPTDSSTREDIR